MLHNEGGGEDWNRKEVNTVGSGRKWKLTTWSDSTTGVSNIRSQYVVDSDNPLWRIGDDKGTLMLIHIEKGLKRVYNLVQKITELLSESGILIFIFLHTSSTVIGLSVPA